MEVRVDLQSHTLTRSDFNYFIISFTKTGTRENENKPQKLTLGSSQALSPKPQPKSLFAIEQEIQDSTGTLSGLVGTVAEVGDLGTFASSLLRNTLSLPKSTAVISFAPSRFSSKIISLSQLGSFIRMVDMRFHQTNRVFLPL